MMLFCGVFFRIVASVRFERRNVSQLSKKTSPLNDRLSASEWKRKILFYRLCILCWFSTVIHWEMCCNRVRHAILCALTETTIDHNAMQLQDVRMRSTILTFSLNTELKLKVYTLLFTSKLLHTPPAFFSNADINRYYNIHPVVSSLGTPS